MALNTASLNPTSCLLTSALEAAAAGRKAVARTLLLTVLESEPHNLRARALLRTLQVLPGSEQLGPRHPHHTERP
jgi:hypothetical protein